jgi:two-component system LytT family sensor kinase
MNRIRQWMLHIVIWIAILVLFVFMAENGNISYRTIVIIGYFGLINIAVFYFNYLLILPAFLNRKKYLWCALAMIFLIITSGFVKCALAYYFYDIVILRGTNKTPINFWDYYEGTVFISCFFIFLSTALKFMVDWFISEKVKNQLEKEKLSAELAFLKSQINPHFLFNSLNNIYSLAYQKSEETPEAILKLSEIMRYMLYESNEDKVELSDEIRYLKNYIELQRLRFKDKSRIKFEIIGETHDKSITPLVLISFVENAFKHGVAVDEESPITINMTIEGRELFFQVINKKGNQNKDETGGIGLQNVKRRLDLLYKDQYRLNIDNAKDTYNCELYLNL